MRVVGYVRVSTGKQVNEGMSPEAQRAKIEGYASVYDLELHAIEEDPGVSAKSLDRPAVRRVLALLDSGAVEGIVVAKLDRLTRSLGDWSYLIDRYFGERARPVRRLFSVADSIDTRSATGRMMLNMVMTIAQWEREIIAERTREVLQFKMSKGERCGGVRYGCDLADDGRMLIENRPEQDVIEFIRLRRALGRTYRRIAAELNGLGVPTKRGHGPWGHSAVAAIFKRTG